MIVQKTLLLKASPQKVWNALTNPIYTQQYMYGCQIESDWKVGSPIYWNSTTENGQPCTMVKGHIQHIQPGQMVQFSTFDPQMGLADIPKNYVSITYQLLPQGEDTLLKLEQGDFSTVELAQKRYDDAAKGWDLVLPLLKTLVEQS